MSGTAMQSVLMAPEHRPYVSNTWARSVRLSLPVRTRYRIVDRILQDAVVRCMVTGDATVHAWVAKHGDALAYAYVPPELRRMGFAYRLIDEMWHGARPTRALCPVPRWFLPGCQYVQDALIEVMAA